MNREDIIRMAREADLVAGLPNSSFSDGIWWIGTHEVGSELEAFAALVASAAQAKEREACAKIAETPIGEYEVVVACGTEPAPYLIPQYANWQDIAKAIRARGQA